MANFIQKMIAASMLEEMTKPKKHGQMTNEEYHRQYQEWHAKKEKAENLFIADLLLNKGRVSEAIVDEVRNKVPVSKIILGSDDDDNSGSGNNSSCTNMMGYAIAFIMALIFIALFQ